jgi:hypothetical protein
MYKKSSLLHLLLDISVTNLCRIAHYTCQVYCAKKYPPAKLTKDAEGLRQHIGRINLVQNYILNLILSIYL